MLSPSPSRVTVESLDRFRANLQSLVAEKAKALPSLPTLTIAAWRMGVRVFAGGTSALGAHSRLAPVCSSFSGCGPAPSSSGLPPLAEALIWEIDAPTRTAGAVSPEPAES